LNIINKGKTITNSPEETIKLAREFSRKLKAGDIVALVGELGAGKTHFIKGLASYFGIENIVSPSFTIVRQYSGKIPLVHIDFYRIESTDECSIILYEYLSEDSINAIEWAEKSFNNISDYAYGVLIEFTGENSRCICIDRWKEIKKKIKKR